MNPALMAFLIVFGAAIIGGILGHLAGRSQWKANFPDEKPPTLRELFENSDL